MKAVAQLLLLGAVAAEAGGVLPRGALEGGRRGRALQKEECGVWRKRLNMCGPPGPRVTDVPDAPAVGECGEYSKNTTFSGESLQFDVLPREWCFRWCMFRGDCQGCRFDHENSGCDLFSKVTSTANATGVVAADLEMPGVDSMIKCVDSPPWMPPNTTDPPPPKRTPPGRTRQQELPAGLCGEWTEGADFKGKPFSWMVVESREACAEACVADDSCTGVKFWDIDNICGLMSLKKTLMPHAKAGFQAFRPCEAQSGIRVEGDELGQLPVPRNAGFEFREFPAAEGTVHLNETVSILASFDGGYTRYTFMGGGQEEGQPPLFELADGATLRNVIIGTMAADGIHCLGSCLLENIWWEDVGEDAATLKGEEPQYVLSVVGGGARDAGDKVFQHNGSGKIMVRNFQADTLRKLVRTCGNCEFQAKRKIAVTNSIVRNVSVEVVGINVDQGDDAVIRGLTVEGEGIWICGKYESSSPGTTPPWLGFNGSLPGGGCSYREDADIMRKPSDVPQPLRPMDKPPCDYEGCFCQGMECFLETPDPLSFAGG